MDVLVEYKYTPKTVATINRTSLSGNLGDSIRDNAPITNI